MAESTVKVVFLGDTAKLKGSLEEVDKAAGSAEGGFGRLGTAIGGALAVGSVVAFGKGAFDAAIESQKIAAQTEAVIKSTGGSAQLTAKQIGDMASALSAKNGVDDEAIQQGQNLLLTFTNIQDRAGKGNDIFSQSSQIMVDMAAAMGTDVKGGAIQLGKALNDPIAGISALSRVGVTFTDEQKKQIRTMQEHGDIAGAQKVILAELSKEFGGSAAAQATATDRMKIAFGNLQEDIGAKLIPVVEKVSTWMVSSGIPLFERFAGFIGSKLSPVIDYLRRGIANMAEAFHYARNGGWEAHGIFEKIGVVLAEIVGGVRAFIAAFKAGGDEVTSSGFAGFLERLGLIARDVFDWLRVNVPPAMEAVGRAAEAVFGWLSVHVPPVLEAIRSAAEVAFGWLRDNVPPAIDAVRNAIEVTVGAIEAWWRTHWEDIRAVVEFVFGLIRTIIETALGLIEAFWRTWGGTLTTYVQGLFNGIRDAIDAVLGVIRGIMDVVMGLIRGDWERVWDGIKQVVQGVWDGIKALIELAIAGIRLAIETAMKLVAGVFDAAWDAIKGAASAAWDGIKGAVSDAADSVWKTLSGLPDRIKGLTFAFATAAASLGKGILDGIISGISGIASGAADFAQAFGNAVIDVLNGQVIDRINSALQFTIKGPGWLPDISVDPPDIPHIPKFHTGGIVPGFGEQLALLKGGEGVFTKAQMRAMGGTGGVNVVVNVNGGLGGPERIGAATADAVRRELAVLLRGAVA